MEFAIAAVIFLLIFLNGATDACGSIATAVCSGALSLRRGAILCGVCNGIGGLCGVWLFDGIGESVLSAWDFGTSDEIGVLTSLTVTVLFALIAWIVALPTSESHALLAAAAGASAALSGNGSVFSALLPSLLWMSLCVLAGAVAGTFLPRFLPLKLRPAAVRRWQIVSAGASSFLHGVQDLSKFCAFLSLVGVSAHHPALLLFGAGIMGIGSLCGGRRMTDAVGDALAELRPRPALAADLACDVALLALSLGGIPASTTHTKTAAVAAVAAVSADCRIHKRQFLRCIAAWVITFPVCGAWGYCLARILFAVL